MFSGSLLKLAAATAACGLVAVATVPALASHTHKNLFATTRPARAAFESSTPVGKAHAPRLHSLHATHGAKAKPLTSTHGKKLASKHHLSKATLATSHKHAASKLKKSSKLDKTASSAFTM